MANLRAVLTELQVACIREVVHTGEDKMVDISAFGGGGGCGGDYLFAGFDINGFNFGTWGGNWQGSVNGGMNNYGGFYGSIDGSYNPGWNGGGSFYGSTGYDTSTGWNAGVSYGSGNWSVSLGFNTGGSVQGSFAGVSGKITF